MKMILVAKSILRNDSSAALLHYIPDCTAHTYIHVVQWHTAYQNMTSISLTIFNEENCRIFDFARSSCNIVDA